MPFLRPILNLAYLYTLLVLFFVGRFYQDLTSGLASDARTGPFYCNQLQSSGGEDTVMVFALSLFVFPFATRIYNLPGRPAWFEVAIFGAALSFSLFALFLASLDCAEIFYTAFGIPDPLLATGLVALAVSAPLFWLIRRG